MGSCADFPTLATAGECEVSVDGAVVGTLEDGQSFGELALMYCTPRAATVRAVRDTVLWCLDRPTFQQMLQRTAAAALRPAPPNPAPSPDFVPGLPHVMIIGLGQQA